MFPGTRLFYFLAKLDGLLRGFQIETRGELHSAQNAQWIFREGRARVTQNFVPQIRFATEKIEQPLSSRIVHQRVDREIPARCRFLRVECWIEFDFETFMARGNFGIAG